MSARTDAESPVCPLCWKSERLRVPLVEVGAGTQRWQHADVRRARACGVYEYRGGVPTQPTTETEAPAA